jgi:hypothetical protein
VSDTTDGKQEDRASGKRGEAAWKEDRERIAARNDEARKAGKQRREDYERGRQEARNAADLRRRAALLKETH